MHSATLAQYIHVCILVQEKIKSKFLFKIEKNSLTFCTCTYLRIVYRIDNFGTVDSITFLYWWYGIVYLPKKKKKKSNSKRRGFKMQKQIVKLPFSIDTIGGV